MSNDPEQDNSPTPGNAYSTASETRAMTLARNIAKRIGEKDSFSNKLFFTLLDKLILGVLLAVASYVLTKELDLDKFAQQQAHAQASHQRQVSDELLRARLATVSRQLSEFYRPLKVRIQRDNVTWEFFYYDESGRLTIRNTKLGKQGILKILIPNQLEMLHIIDLHSDLIRSDFEAEGPAVVALRSILAVFEGHVALHRTLRELDDRRNPEDIGDRRQWAWPSCLEALIDCRIAQLEGLRKEETTLRQASALAIQTPCPAANRCF